MRRELARGRSTEVGDSSRASLGRSARHVLADAGKHEETVRVPHHYGAIRRLNRAHQESLLAVEGGHYARDFYFFTRRRGEGLRPAEYEPTDLAVHGALRR